ncbi:MAG: ribonuclease D [Dermatophilaceae bacterium]
MTLVDGDLPADIALTMRTAGRVAVDTETGGLDWARDRLHLCQLFTPETGPVLLRHVEGELHGLGSVMRDPAVLKVMHFAPFDLRFLEAQWGVETRSVACTKAASKLLDPTLIDHSLKALLERHLGVLIEKGEVRTSDWSAVTLSDEQVAYAVGDVSHLLDLHQLLASRLEAAGRSSMFEQVCAYMPVDSHLEVEGYPNPLTY